MHDRILILDKKDSFDVGKLDGLTPSEIVNEFRKIEEWYEYEISQSHQVKFHVESYGYDGGVDLFFGVYRFENDKEYADRTEKERRDTEKKKATEKSNEAKERREYERLKKKFG